MCGVRGKGAKRPERAKSVHRSSGDASESIKSLSSAELQPGVLRPAFGPYHLAGWCYQAALRLYELTDRPPGTYVRRFIAIAPGNRSQAYFNRGDHLLAALSIVDALEQWDVYRAWTDEHADQLSDAVLEVGVESYLRHQADLLGRVQLLIPALAPDEVQLSGVMSAILQRDWEQARTLLRADGWALSGSQAGGIEWWDE